MESSKVKKNVSRNHIICRTCLKRTENAFRVHENISSFDHIKISNALKYIVPEIYLGATPNPSICGDCKISLRIAYIFKKKCTESENMVGSFLKKICSTGKAVLLEDVLRHIQKTDNLSTSLESNIISDDSSLEDINSTSNISEMGGKNLTFCEETGLFVDGSGNYFNAHGNPLEKDQIEAEKINLDKKINKLFEISSVFSLANENEKNGEPLKDSSKRPNAEGKSDKSKKPRIMVKSFEKLVNSNVQSQQIVISQKDMSKKKNYIEIGVKEMTVGGEVNKVIRVLNNDFLNPSGDNVKEQERKSNENIVKSTSSNSSIEQRNNDLHSPRQQKKIGNRESTIKQGNSANYEYGSNIDGIIDTLQDDEDDVGHYVDVPEFVLINQFTIKDLEDLKKQQKTGNTETLNSNATGNTMTNSNITDNVESSDVEEINESDDDETTEPPVILNYSAPTSKKRVKRHLSVDEKKIIINIHNDYVLKNPGSKKTESVDFTSKASGASVGSVYKILAEFETGNQIIPPKKYHRNRRILDNISEEVKMSIREKVQAYLLRNEIPTCDKVLCEVNNDENLPDFKKSTFLKLLKELNLISTLANKQ